MTYLGCTFLIVFFGMTTIVSLGFVRLLNKQNKTLKETQVAVYASPWTSDSNNKLISLYPSTPKSGDAWAHVNIDYEKISVGDYLTLKQIQGIVKSKARHPVIGVWVTVDTHTKPKWIQH